MLKEGKYAYVIFSNPRLMPGHLLVIPKRHVEGRLQDLSNEERNEIMVFLAEFQEKILEKLASGCDIRQNYKPYVENSDTHVNHMHFHIHPRGDEDELYKKADIYRKPLYKELPEDEKERLFRLLAT
ncbi:MAG: HIT domain-containing protein [bacterium]|nr:HIT domain-containing protein [bacterium]